MSLYYLAKKVRPDILSSVSWCASRVLNLTEEDDRVLEYLLNTINKKLILRIGGKVHPSAFTRTGNR
jgi:hypothetical protein